MALNDEICQQGENAYFDGAKIDECPHKDASSRRRWFEGFEIARKAVNDYEGATQ